MHRRALADAVEPGFERRVIGPVDAVPLVVDEPGVDGDVGDGVVAAGDEGARALDLPVHHAVEALGLGGVALNAVGHFFSGEEAKVPGLPQHGADAAHLEHEPLQHGVARRARSGQQAARFVGQVNEDGARLEQRQRLPARAFAIDQRRNLVVGADLEKVRRELLVLANIDGVQAIGQAALLQHDGGLEAVGRGPRIKVKSIFMQDSNAPTSNVHTLVPH